MTRAATTMKSTALVGVAMISFVLNLLAPEDRRAAESCALPLSAVPSVTLHLDIDDYCC